VKTFAAKGEYSIKKLYISLHSLEKKDLTDLQPRDNFGWGHAAGRYCSLLLNSPRWF
jgi:hypothetical protein